MKTLLRHIAFAMAAFTMMVACSINDEGSKPKMGEGQIEFTCSVDADIDDVTTRATSGYKLPAELIPQNLNTALQVKITGEYDDPRTKDVVDMQQYTGSWSTLQAYNEGDVKLNQGGYSAELENKPQRDENGNVIEGEANPYFKGGAYSNTIEVIAGVTTQANIALSLANCCFTLKVTEMFMNYYSDVTLTIHSASNSWTYNPTTHGAVSPLIFVNAGQKLKFSGSATKQNGVEVEFAEAELNTTLQKDTHYNIIVDHTTAGGSGITIQLGNDYTEINEVEIELNTQDGE
ncbi:MAG: DUF4493 domain-containing protein [Alistipes sp.]|nr:DUF4493 domain-containing protein [Alistipes sp.]